MIIFRAANYKQQLVREWTSIFPGLLKQELDHYVIQAKRSIDICSLSVSAANKDNYPELDLAFDILKDNMLKTSGTIQFGTEAMHENIMEIIKDLHRKVPKIIKTSLARLYAQCAAQGGKDIESLLRASANVLKGRGCYAKNKAAHHTHISDHGISMYSSVSNELRSGLGKMLDKISDEFAIGRTEVINHLKQEIQIFLEVHSSNGSRTSHRKVVSPAKVKLQKVLQTQFDNLEKAWNEEIPFEAEEQDDLADLDFEKADGFNLKIEDDDEYQDEDSEC